MTTPTNRWELAVLQSPSKAAQRLDYARKRLARLRAGEIRPAGSDDTIEARQAEVDGLTKALGDQDIVLCDDCKEQLRTKQSRARGVGPRCWAKRQRRASTEAR